MSFPTTTQSVDQMFTLTSEENSEIGSAKQTEILGSLKDLRMEVTIFKDVEPDRQESQENVVARKDSLQFEPSPSPTLLDGDCRLRFSLLSGVMVTGHVPIWGAVHTCHHPQSRQKRFLCVPQT